MFHNLSYLFDKCLTDMATITPYLRTRNLKGPLYPVCIRVIHNRKSTEVRVQDVKIEPKYWDDDKKTVKASHDRATRFNRLISDERKRIEDNYYNLSDTKSNFNVVDIINSNVDQVDDISLTDYLRNYYNSNPDNISPGTLKYHKSFLNLWEENYGDLAIQEISRSLIEKFRNSLVKKGYKQNTIHVRLKILRKMLLRALNEGIIKSNPMASIKLKQERGVREYLTEDELLAIEEVDNLDVFNSLTRDVFLFGCYTGLRIGDICSLKRSDLKAENGFLRLVKKMGKTSDIVSFKLNKRAQEILEYHIEENENYVFPMLRKYKELNPDQERKKTESINASMNRALKNIAGEAEVEKSLSMHCGRHTFAVLSLSKGADIYVLSKVLGHSSISTTEIYAKIIDKRKDELTELWNS